MTTGIKIEAMFRVARVGRGRWLVTDARSDKPVASFDGWRAARDHVKALVGATVGTLAATATTAGTAASRPPDALRTRRN